MRSRTTTWRVGGILLGVSGLLALTGMRFLGNPQIAGAIIDMTWAGGVLVLAVGLSREGSVVRRRPLGMTALIVLALVPGAANLIFSTFPIETVSAEPSSMILAASVSYTAAAICIAAGIVGSVQIARLGAVPRRWRWAPMWALGISVGAALAQQVVLFGLGSAGAAPDVVVGSGFIGTIGALAPTLGLGVVALLAAADQRPESVEVYRSR